MERWYFLDAFELLLVVFLDLRKVAFGAVLPSTGIMAYVYRFPIVIQCYFVNDI